MLRLPQRKSKNFGNFSKNTIYSIEKGTVYNLLGFNTVPLGGTAVSPIELLIGRQYCFAVIKKKLR